MGRYRLRPAWRYDMRRVLSGLPHFHFDPDLAVFTPAMAIRAGTLFAGQVPVQGHFDYSGTPDVLSFPRGAQVHDNFYESFDPYQGTVIITGLTSERTRDPAETHEMELMAISPVFRVVYEHDNDRFRQLWGGIGLDYTHSIVAGTPLAVAARYDAANPLDGANYLSFSINDVPAFGGTMPATTSASADIYLGSDPSGTVRPANSLFEGTAFCRLPLWDGAYGVDINGSGVDIIAALAAVGYEDLAKLIPAWHIPYFLPTDSTPGALPTTGQMWGWDYAANVFGVDGWCAANYAASSWVTQGAPTAGPINLADPVDGIFGLQGYEWLCAAADEGPTYSFAGLDAGENFLLVVDAHEEGVTTTGANLLLNPGFETGGTGGNFNGGAEIDDGVSDDFDDWEELSVNDGAGDKLEATATVHAGSVAVKMTRTTTYTTIRQSFVVTSGARYGLSFWTRGDGAVAGRYGIEDLSSGTEIVIATSTGVSGVIYTQVLVYFTAPRACSSVRISFIAPPAPGVCYFDDVSTKAVEDDIRISIVDDTNGGLLTNFPDWDFGAGSGYVQMAEGVVTFELPTIARHGVGADCTAITIKVVGTIAAQTVYLHQVLLYENLIDNPSVETGAGNPWIPDGWVNSGLDAGEGIQSGVPHSGLSAMQIACNDTEGIITAALAGVVSGDFLCMGWFSQGTDVGVVFYGSNVDQQTGGDTYTTLSATGAYVHQSEAGRATGVAIVRFIQRDSATTDVIFDDIYCVPLLAKTLTVTPRTKANSTEGDWLTIDGYDSAPQPIPAGAITATRGHVKIKIKPRHDIADMRSFGNTLPIFFQLYGDATNLISVRISAANTVELRFNDGGGAHAATWAAAGALVADAEYLFEVKWNPVRIWLIADGVTQITINQPVNFATVPTHIYPGSHQGGSLQIDAAFAKP